MSSDDRLCKQFGQRSGPTKVGPDLDSNCLTVMVFVKQFFKKVDFEKKTSADENYPVFRQRVNTLTLIETPMRCVLWDLSMVLMYAVFKMASSPDIRHFSLNFISFAQYINTYKAK